MNGAPKQRAQPGQSHGLCGAGGALSSWLDAAGQACRGGIYSLGMKVWMLMQDPALPDVGRPALDVVL